MKVIVTKGHPERPIPKHQVFHESNLKKGYLGCPMNLLYKWLVKWVISPTYKWDILGL